MPDATPPAIAVVLDTSVLSGLNVRKSLELKLLGRLCKDRKLDLLVPSVVFNEWVGQQTEEWLRRLREAQSAVFPLKEAPAELGLKCVGNCLEELDHVRKVRTEALVTALSNQLLGLGMRVLKDDSIDITSVLDGYFNAKPPFGSRRSRTDIPDAFILSQIAAIKGGYGTVLVAVADGRLGKAVTAIGGTVCSSLGGVLAAEPIVKLSQDQQFHIWWENNVPKAVEAIRVRGLDQAILEGMVIQELHDKHVGHADIPGDEQEARIVGVASPYCEIKWEQVESVGEGILKAPVEVEAELYLAFEVFKGDAWDVPDWVQVRDGDWANDHYFDASGTRRAKYCGSVSIGVPPCDPKDIGEELDFSLSDLVFEGFVD